MDSNPFMTHLRPKFIVFVCALLVNSVHGNTNVETIYKTLLSGTNFSGLIVFEREITYPTIPAISARIQQTDNGADIKPAISNKNYFSYFWSGSNYIVACSSDAPITSENDIRISKKLYGYDGNNYWRFMRDAGYTYINSGEDRRFLAPIDSTSVLTVIPKDEALNSQGKYVSNATLSTINELSAECRRVAQLGFSFPMSGRPEIVNSNELVFSGFGGRVQSAHINGNFQKPNLIYFDSSPTVPASFRVALNYADDFVVIDKLSTAGKRPVITIRYRVLGFASSALPITGPIFSWSTYKPNEGKLLSELAKDGAIVGADINKDGNLQPTERIIIAANPLAGHAHNRLIIYILFFLVSIILPGILYLAFKQPKKPNNTN